MCQYAHSRGSGNKNPSLILSALTLKFREPKLYLASQALAAFPRFAGNEGMEKDSGNYDFIGDGLGIPEGAIPAFLAS